MTPVTPALVPHLHVTSNIACFIKNLVKCVKGVQKLSRNFIFHVLLCFSKYIQKTKTEMTSSFDEAD